jgi:hypothetical protein
MKHAMGRTIGLALSPLNLGEGSQAISFHP